MYIIVESRFLESPVSRTVPNSSNQKAFDANLKSMYRKNMYFNRCFVIPFTLERLSVTLTEFAMRFIKADFTENNANSNGNFDICCLTKILGPPPRLALSSSVCKVNKTKGLAGIYLGT